MSGLLSCATVRALDLEEALALMAVDAEKPESLTHLGLAKRFRWSIAGTYALLMVENLFLVATPFLIGLVIDGLISGELGPLWVFFGFAGVAVVVSAFRRMFDTRVYGRIFSQIASETVERDTLADRPVSAVAARITFVRDFADFFEIMLPTAVMSLVMLVGSVLMLVFLSLYLFAATLAAASGSSRATRRSMTSPNGRSISWKPATPSCLKAMCGPWSRTGSRCPTSKRAISP